MKPHGDVVFVGKRTTEREALRYATRHRHYKLWGYDHMPATVPPSRLKLMTERMHQRLLDSVSI